MAWGPGGNNLCKRAQYTQQWVELVMVAGEHQWSLLAVTETWLSNYDLHSKQCKKNLRCTYKTERRDFWVRWQSALLEEGNPELDDAPRMFSYAPLGLRRRRGEKFTWFACIAPQR